MKTLVLATATAMALSAPAFADTYDGAGSLNEFVARHFAQDHEPGDGPRFFRQKVGQTTVTMSTSNRDLNHVVRSHFAQNHEHGDGARYKPGSDQSSTVLSTKNNDLARFVFNHLKNEGERGDN
ncbi:hypothetical protein [Ovoidimarina sediminis]|uniref:hypothetical protein n=1 Tax=Ovoidimarina sediminis TaxID=3079856 RepID=UPI0029067C31|nr:hypothetical protein [Rhodophyticola sp. MJ-SS7]MDU8944544.1 hypothetical protein [Rhodophyticola sp. MJ-SS7]